MRSATSESSGLLEGFHDLITLVKLEGGAGGSGANGVGASKPEHLGVEWAVGRRASSTSTSLHMQRDLLLF